jgi:hypothetical protein
MYMLGMFLFLLGERMIGGEDDWRWGLDGLGLICLVLVLAQLGKLISNVDTDPGQKKSFRVAFMAALAGLSSLGIYSLTTDWGLSLMGHDLLVGSDAEIEAAERYWVVMTCLWMLLWLAGTLPFLAADWVLSRNPMAVDPSAVRRASLSALSLALLLGALAPLNYWTSQQDPATWVEDNSYFKAPAPGDQAKMLVANMTEKVTIYAFFPEADVVRDQVERYLRELEGSGGMLAVEVVDQALEPILAEKLKIRDNGWVAFVKETPAEEEGAEPTLQIERLKFGLAKKRRDLDQSTRNKIKGLDEEILQQLRKIASSKRTIYVTTDHGEMHWDAQAHPLYKIAVLKKYVGGYNYKVESLGVAELSLGVPDDAAMVMVLGAQIPFNESEVDALHEYRRAGGSLLLTLRPAFQQTPDMSPLLSPLGLAFDGSQVLAHGNAYAQVTRGPQDPFFIVSKSYTTHSSVSLVQKQKNVTGPLIMPISGVLSAGGSPQDGAQAQVAIKSLPDTWGETTPMPKYDEASDTSKSTFDLAYAVSGPVDAASSTSEEEGEAAPEEWRVFVTAGSNWVGDDLIDNGRGEPHSMMANTQLIQDMLGWLGHDASIQGSVNTEEDRKVEHTKGAAGWIFYGTTFIVPFVFLFLGWAQLTMRRKGGMA